MTAKDIVKEIMSDKGISQSKLAELAGFKSQSNITGYLNRGSSMRVDNLIQMLSAMDCELIVRERTSQEEWVVVEKDD